jgi:hypothetical protein
MKRAEATRKQKEKKKKEKKEKKEERTRRTRKTRFALYARLGFVIVSAKMSATKSKRRICTA